jgi:hypothetical protein
VRDIVEYPRIARGDGCKRHQRGYLETVSPSAIHSGVSCSRLQDRGSSTSAMIEQILDDQPADRDVAGLV